MRRYACFVNFGRIVTHRNKLAVCGHRVVKVLVHHTILALFLGRKTKAEFYTLIAARDNVPKSKGVFCPENRRVHMIPDCQKLQTDAILTNRYAVLVSS